MVGGLNKREIYDIVLSQFKLIEHSQNFAIERVRSMDDRQVLITRCDLFLHSAENIWEGD